MSQHTTPTPPLLLKDHDDSDSDNQRMVPTNSLNTGRLGSEIPIPKTPSRRVSRSGTTTPRSHSRRATPRSNTRNSTPGRGSVRRNPSTPYTLRAMLQVSAATPVRNVLRETRRYTPSDDLRYLSRLLVKERDSQITRETRVLEEQDNEVHTVSPSRLELQPAPVILTQRLDRSIESTQLNERVDLDNELPFTSRLSEQHHTTTLSELDEGQRRVSERMSGRFSLPSNNLPSDLFNDLAVPEAVVDDPSQFDNENFGYDDEYPGLQRPSNFTSDDDDDLDNDLVYSDGDYDFSLLREQAFITLFKPMTSSSSQLTKKPSPESLKIPMSLLRFRARQFLLDTPHQDAKFFKHKQFSKNMLAHIQDISDEFLTQQMADLEAFAKHANRKTINSDDFSLMMKRQKDVNIDDFDFFQPRQTQSLNRNTQLFCLAEVFCNVSELREIEANLYKNEAAIAKKQQKKRRKIELKEEEEEIVEESSSDDLSLFVDTRESLD